jgi:hypothetical protein
VRTTVTRSIESSAEGIGWPNSPCGGNPLYIDPIITFTPTIAPTGIVAFREDSIYPTQYHNDLLFADFNAGNLHRIELTGAGLADFFRHTIACNCGQGGLIEGWCRWHRKYAPENTTLGGFEAEVREAKLGFGPTRIPYRRGSGRGEAGERGMVFRLPR